MTVWVRWKWPVKSAIILHSEDVEGPQYIRDNTGNNYIKVEKSFNRLMTEFFEGNNTEELMQCMFVHIKTQVENPRKPESGFTLDQIMHLHINFHQLALKRGSSYIELPKGKIAVKIAVINQKNNDEQCFTWALIVALHHKEIDEDVQCI